MTFVAVHKILIDANDCEPVLVVVTSARRNARSRIRKVALVNEIVKPFYGVWYGMPMWFLRMKVPGGKADMARLVEKFPPKRIEEDFNWAYHSSV